jgi:hypothetical protein
MTESYLKVPIKGTYKTNCSILLEHYTASVVEHSRAETRREGNNCCCYFLNYEPEQALIEGSRPRFRLAFLRHFTSANLLPAVWSPKVTIGSTNPPCALFHNAATEQTERASHSSSCPLGYQATEAVRCTLTTLVL